METVVTRLGQTVVSPPIRKRYNIHEGDRLVWPDDGRTIKVIPVPADAIKALRGMGKGENLLQALMAQR